MNGIISLAIPCVPTSPIHPSPTKTATLPHSLLLNVAGSEFAESLLLFRVDLCRWKRRAHPPPQKNELKKNEKGRGDVRERGVQILPATMAGATRVVTSMTNHSSLRLRAYRTGSASGPTPCNTPRPDVWRVHGESRPVYTQAWGQTKRASLIASHKQDVPCHTAAPPCSPV